MRISLPVARPVLAVAPLGRIRGRDLDTFGRDSRDDFYGPADLTRMDVQRALDPACGSGPDPNIALLLGAPPDEAPGLAAAASPVTYLHPGQDLPPIFIAHGDADCVVPYQQSVDLHEAIEAVAPGRSRLAIVPGSGHYLDFDFGSQNEALATFLAETVGAG